ncbi:hypothetical protein [Plantactinospora sp. GCM10030261]|uniref:hypothetical protein n=1 Tax=Plantactinospora sp. GCM10030261 TaxID=3273420 RepID=UPI0036129906
MKRRWLPVGVLAGVLFAINVVARLIIRLGFEDDTEAADRVSLAMFAVIGLILAGVAFTWGRDRPVARWSADMAAAVLAAMLLTIFVGPFVSGVTPFSSGAGAFFAQIWLYAGFTAVGALVGYLVLVALGKDHRSESLRRYAQTRQAKPRRVIRRR